MYLGHFFDTPRVKLTELSALLDTCGPIARRRAVQSLDRAALAALYDAAAPGDATEGLTLDFLVPAGTEALHEVIHNGRNSLPMFNNFQKRFCRPDGDAEQNVLWGYNEGSTRAFVGPGYFVARTHGEGELVVDYTALPPRHPVPWPEILPNEARLGRFVWVGMKDVIRRVSQHVSIGRAYRADTAMDAWFALCREDPSPA